MTKEKYDVELLAPAGSFEALTAAINAGCDAVYFGVEKLNMRANAAQKFTLADLEEIAKTCHESEIQCYLALNVLVYDKEIEEMKSVVDTVKKAGVDAIITFDPSVIEYATKIGVEVHISTQHSISNINTVKFFSRWADRMVLARELSLEQIKYITEQIKKQDIRGPKGELIEIEVFMHGAMCVSVSGRCGMSLYFHNSSANRGMCYQPCRRNYTVIDQATGKALEIDNEFVMSPEDLCTIGMLDELLESGVKSLKIEGRGRGPEYVDTVVKTYRKAISAIEDETYNEEKIKNWNKDLGTVFHRGLSDGFYHGKAFKHWSGVAGNKASQKKVLVGVVNRFYPKISVTEVLVQSGELKEKEELIFIGKTTGVHRDIAKGLIVEEKAVKTANKGDEVTFVTSKRVRAGDKVYKVVKN